VKEKTDSLQTVMLADGSLDEDEEMTYLGSVVSTTGSNGEGQSRGNWLTQVLC